MNESQPLARNHALTRIRTAPDGPRTIFAEQSRRPTIAFQGTASYVDREADRLGVAAPDIRSRVKGEKFLTEASNAIGNACGQPDAARAQASIDHAVTRRDALAVALAATEAAIVETTRALGLPDPPFAHRPEVKPNAKHHGKQRDVLDDAGRRP